MRVLALVLVICGLSGPRAPRAQASAAIQSASTPPATLALVAPRGASPVRDYVAEVRANYSPENRAYYSTRVALAFVGPCYVVVAALALLFSGLSARMRDIAHRVSRRRYVRVLAYLVLCSVAVSLLMFPLGYWGDFALQHRYGLSSQSFGSWLGDQSKSIGLAVLFLGVCPFLSLAYRRIERSPVRWWLWLSVAALPIIAAGVLIQPLVVEPAFDKFTPLQDAHLRARILALAARAGVPASRVDQVDASLQTNTYNAYVSGFGGTQHIVLWDTTLRGMTEDEILFVTGHEIGHYKLHHIWKGVAFDSLLSVVVLFVTWLVARPLVRRFGARWGFATLDDVASMPLLAAIVSLVVFLADPAANAFSRRVEHEADVYALEITRANDAGACAFIKMGTQNRSNPEPSAFVRWALYSHPPLIERVRFALEYRPWEAGRPNRFFR